MTDEQSTPATDTPEVVAPAPVTRICRRCQAQATTTADACPICGRRYMRRRPSRKLVVIASVLVVVIGGGAIAAVVEAGRRADQRERERIALVKQRADAARERQEAAAAKAAQEREDSDALEVSMRKLTERELRTSIVKDAQSRFYAGELDDRASHVSCDNTDGHLDDLDSNSGEYSCIAVTNKTADGSSEGYRFSARVDYEEGSYTWHLGD